MSICHPPPLQDLPYLVEDLEHFPKDLKPFLLGDLNVDLEDLSKPRSRRVAEITTNYGLEDLLQAFAMSRRYKHRKIWFQYRSDLSRTIRSRCDYILGTDRHLFEYIRIKDPHHYSSDHFMLVARYLVKPTKCHRDYL